MNYPIVSGVRRFSETRSRNAEPCLKLDDITSSIGRRAIKSVSSDGETEQVSSVRMVALVFSPLGSEITHNQLIPRFSDIHVRSRDYIDFYFAGIDKSNSPAWGDFDDKMHLGHLTAERNVEVEWSYSSFAFDNLRREIESHMNGRWSYSGESDLLLLNASIDSEGTWVLNFDKVIFISLWHALNDKAIDTVPILLENIIRYREKHVLSGIWEWSDEELLKQGANAFMNGLISLLPTQLQGIWKKGRHFAVLNCKP